MKFPKENFIDLIYPIGSLYWSKNSTDPAELFGGTWERVKDTFILAAGDTYSAGSTGGSNNHRHELGASGFAYGQISSSGSLYVRAYTGVSTYSSDYTLEGAGIPSPADNLTRGIRLGGTTETVDNMPPYKVYYCWERVS